MDEILNNKTVVTVIFTILGLLVAYVTFGFLKSEAQGEFRGYQIGGAAAGFAVTFMLLTSFYKWAQKASNEPKELRERIEELQQKLLRGSPRPLGFTVEISEQQKIVLARPEGWHKRGGMMFDFEIVEMAPQDNYPARFTCSFVPITPEYEKHQMDGFYDIFEQNIRDNPFNYYPRREDFSLGGESQSTNSIKVIAAQHMRLEFYDNPYGGKNKMEACLIDEKEYLENTSPASAAANVQLPAEQSGETTSEECLVNGRRRVNVKYAKISHLFVACYREDLKKIYFFEFMDDEKDFGRTSGIFNQVLGSTRFLN